MKECAGESVHEAFVRVWHRYRNALVALSFVIYHLSFSIGCSEAKEHLAPAVNPEDSVSMMVSYGVNTLISDSGVIKYRIVTEQWDVNTVRQPSRWEFMKGVFFEQFDEQFHVQGYIQADTAWYYDQRKLWKLRGRVSIRNIDGLIYKSEELFWDMQRHELYSNVFSHITTPERSIEGNYFRSDERMEHYFISNSKGSFMAEDMENDNDEEKPAAAPDTTEVQTPQVRPAATRHAAGRNN
ncbi:MAG: LPS export ABC transporter periplasmic protein LptC [Prevotella sp.]|nr:LPS export ABC transporter periplasmic protein LptC [Prevotella sp.]